jgi:hypothetical protein
MASYFREDALKLGMRETTMLVSATGDDFHEDLDTEERQQ